MIAAEQATNPYERVPGVEPVVLLFKDASVRGTSGAFSWQGVVTFRRRGSKEPPRPEPSGFFICDENGRRLEARTIEDLVVALGAAGWDFPIFRTSLKRYSSRTPLVSPVEVPRVPDSIGQAAAARS